MDGNINDRERALTEYAALKEKIKDFESQLEELRPQIEDLIDESGSKSYELPGKGIFTVTERTSWEYSDKLKKEADILKEKQKLEQLEKIATIKNISRVLSWKSFKGGELNE